mmetsp:Transcript_21464/g.24552  ORF Transcript_21464/g.24552 Transcript_21464/m.24552 type:complete len:137 (-) Transcript_21464:96-506(-)
MHGNRSVFTGSCMTRSCSIQSTSLRIIIMLITRRNNDREREREMTNNEQKVSIESFSLIEYSTQKGIVVLVIRKILAKDIVLILISMLLLLVVFRVPSFSLSLSLTLELFNSQRSFCIVQRKTDSSRQTPKNPLLI